ncbi:hypothetical protein AB0F91_31165 [Amycolatopsis sp. NPDC023774]|uniref:hypothetical protein n=1 Tax=Amycolatopsis sp. NPDC023774 TaxID=3155015 RepID=UPI0034040B2C
MMPREPGSDRDQAGFAPGLVLDIASAPARRMCSSQARRAAAGPRWMAAAVPIARTSRSDSSARRSSTNAKCRKMVIRERIPCGWSASTGLWSPSSSR